MSSGLLAALCASRPDLYPRSRWTGCDVATDDLGIVESCHRLLSTSYKRMLRGSYGGVLRAPAAAAQGDSDGIPLGGPAQDAPSPLENDHHGGNDDAGARVEADARARDEGPDWVKINDAHRKQAIAWLERDPFANIVLQRLLLEPLHQLLTDQLTVASEQWEREQQCKAAEAHAKGATDWADTRQFRLAIAAGSENEKRLFGQLALLWTSPKFWILIPPTSWTISFRSLCFRPLSRLACAVHKLLVAPRTSFPVRLFLLLQHPEMAEEFAKVPDCMLDAWSLRMRQEHPTLSDDTFRAKLAVCALLAWKDISAVEARHASIRRMLIVASTQTHQQAFHELSAQWVFLQHRNRMADFAPWTVGRQKKKNRAKKKMAKKQVGRRPLGPLLPYRELLLSDRLTLERGPW